jgi:small neutral amino acid transporter SnatA (MarC family)
MPRSHTGSLCCRYFFSSLALLVAAFLGESILSSYGIPLPVLALSAGIILFLVALQSVLQQFTPHSEDTVGTTPTPTMDMALTPLAFPTIVTPYGIAALVVFLALSPDMQCRADHRRRSGGVGTSDHQSLAQRAGGIVRAHHCRRQ